jgi:hypothetical protein
VRHCTALYYLFESLTRWGVRTLQTTLCQDCCQTKFLSHNHLCMFLSSVLREFGVQGERDMQCFDLFFFRSYKKPDSWNPPVKYVYALTFPLFPFYVRGLTQYWKQVIICWNSPYLPPPYLWLFIPVRVCVCVCAWRAWNLRQDSPGLELVETALLISTARAKNASVVSLGCIVYPAGRRRKTSIEKKNN